MLEQITFDWTIKLSLILSLITLLINLFIYNKNRKITLENQKVRVLSTIRQYHSEMRIWADKVIFEMTFLGLACDLNPELDQDFFKTRHKIRINLSSLLDSGKLFLPNEEKDKFGKNKELAFRGLRKKTLDLVYECYQYAGELNYQDQKPNLELRKKIMDCKRKFVTELTKELDPEKYIEEATKELKALISKK